MKAPVAGALFVLNKIDNISDNYDDWGAMAARIEALSNAKLIQTKQERGFGRVLDESSDAHDIVDSLRAISFLIDIFQIDTALLTQVGILGVQKVLVALADDHELEKLHPVLDSRYDTEGSRACMDGTRVSVLAQLLAWATDPSAPSVYWLNGMAGTGKSAIARSFAKLLDSEPHTILGANFFCSRASEAYGRAVIDVLKKNRDRSFPSCTLTEQFEKLVVLPSAALSGSDEKHNTLVVIIDALDECLDAEGTRTFLKTLLRLKPTGLKFFLTCRPEVHIQQELVHQTALRLHDIERDIVAADMRSKVSQIILHVLGK
ncbi:hypothetical protein B0H14DRAFT_3432243 [Mycena olivaceomarginata]|nr:hypothetical protein B0H14DRAFT_3432243 [Mycena olivaceomarginata]